MVRSVPKMSSYVRMMLQAAIIVGASSSDVLRIYLEDLRRRLSDRRVHRMPIYSNSNPDGWGQIREYKHYGAPHYGSDHGLSAYAFRSHFMFGHDQFPVVLAALDLPERMEYQRGRYVDKEVALLIFLKRLRTRGNKVIDLVDFFGRSIGYISNVFRTVL